MSKQILRSITDSINQKFEHFSKQIHNHAKAKNMGVRVGKFQPGDEKLFQEADRSGNTQKAVEFMDRALATNASELYFNMPELHISDAGSIKTLDVSVYSAEQQDNILLHRIFGKVRELKSFK